MEESVFTTFNAAFKKCSNDKLQRITIDTKKKKKKLQTNPKT